MTWVLPAEMVDLSVAYAALTDSIAKSMAAELLHMGIAAWLAFRSTSLCNGENSVPDSDDGMRAGRVRGIR